MRRILLSFLVLVIVAGLFAATGYAGYRLGYAQGTQGGPSTTNREETPRPSLRPFDTDGPRRIPGRGFGFDRGFHRGFDMRGFPIMGFGFFSLLRFLAWIAILALIVWVFYLLLTRSGWQLTRTVQTAPSPSRPVETDTITTTENPED